MKRRIGYSLILLLSAASFLTCRQPLLELDDENQILLNFSFSNSENPLLTTTSKAVITGREAYIQLPAGTDRSSLIPRFEVRGKGLQVGGEWQVSGQSTQNFSRPVLYDLIREDGSSVQYTVTAGYGYLGENSLYEFYFRSDLNAAIPSTVKGESGETTIAFHFPFESTVGPMIPSFSVPPGAVVSYDGVVLTSDAAPVINPANGGTLKVDFTDGSSRIYTFTTDIKSQDFVYVSSSGRANVSGSQVNPLSTLEEALTLAVNKNIPEIRVSAGAYTLTGNLTITSNITIRGGYSSSDWSDRSFDNPNARISSYKTFINTSSAGAGSATEYLGTLIYKGTGVGRSSLLEGVVIQAGSGNMTAAVSVLDGAIPVIVFSDLKGGSNQIGAAAFVSNSSPSFFSSVMRAASSGGSSQGVGLYCSTGATPQVVSCYISSNDGVDPEDGSGVLLNGSGAGGSFYNNFIEGRGILLGAAVRLTTPGGYFVNNIIANNLNSPWSICFYEETPGVRPTLLQNNNFSSLETSVLYKKDGTVDVNDVTVINSLGYASSSGNTGFRFQSFGVYASNSQNQTVPPPMVYGGKTPSTDWARDLYNKGRTSSSANKWSMGAIEVDGTDLDEEYVKVDDTSFAHYDGDWSSIDLREAVTLVNTWDKTSTIVYPSGSFTTTISDSIVVSSDLSFQGASGRTVLDGFNSSNIFILDDGESSTLEISFQNVTFQNANSPTVKGGGIFSRENLSLYNCLFLSNRAPAGGAVYQEGGKLMLANTVFDLNGTSSGAGGALYLSDSSLMGINMVFTGNDVSGGLPISGSAIYLDNSPAAIVHSTLINNLNSSGGSAAIYSTGTPVSVINSIFFQNAGTPADLDIFAGFPEIKGSIVETGSYVSAPDSVVVADPQVNSTVIPSGGDGWLTGIENLTLKMPSVSANRGVSNTLIQDWPDADGDGNRTEPFPVDILGHSRVISGVPDAGAYESSN